MSAHLQPSPAASHILVTPVTGIENGDVVTVTFKPTLTFRNFELSVTIPSQIAYHHDGTTTSCCIPPEHAVALIERSRQQLQNMGDEEWAAIEWAPYNLRQSPLPEMSNFLSQSYREYVCGLTVDITGRLIPPPECHVSDDVSEGMSRLQQSSLELPWKFKGVHFDFGPRGHLSAYFQPDAQSQVKYDAIQAPCTMNTDKVRLYQGDQENRSSSLRFWADDQTGGCHLIYQPKSDHGTTTHHPLPSLVRLNAFVSDARGILASMSNKEVRLARSNLHYMGGVQRPIRDALQAAEAKMYHQACWSFDPAYQSEQVEITEDRLNCPGKSIDIRSLAQWDLEKQLTKLNKNIETSRQLLKASENFHCASMQKYLENLSLLEAQLPVDEMGNRVAGKILKEAAGMEHSEASKLDQSNAEESSFDDSMMRLVPQVLAWRSNLSAPLDKVLEAKRHLMQRKRCLQYTRTIGKAILNIHPTWLQGTKFNKRWRLHRLMELGFELSSNLAALTPVHLPRKTDDLRGPLAQGFPESGSGSLRRAGRRHERPTFQDMSVCNLQPTLCSVVRQYPWSPLPDDSIKGFSLDKPWPYPHDPSDAPSFRLALDVHFQGFYTEDWAKLLGTKELPLSGCI